MTEPDLPTDVGVGPWVGEPPIGEQYDPELLRDGDRRNVVDHYRYWTLEAIVADLDLHRHAFHVAIENWQHDFNIGSIVRTANAFAAAEVHIIGKKRWNRRGAMVTDRYQHVRHHETVADFAGWAAGAGLVVLGIDNVDDSEPIETAELPRECVLVFGQEGPGLSDEARAACARTLSIAQFGSTRSINAGAAAAIAMHAWIREHAELPAD
jgi:tRNA G18 (ribose-2'-O)-methylase SpoU